MGRIIQAKKDDDVSTIQQQQDNDWRKQAEEMKKEIMDPWLLNSISFQKTRVEAAKEYGPGSEEGGLFPGIHKYLGGAIDQRDGCIYGIPSHAPSLLCLHPDDDNNSYKIRMIPLPESVAHVKFKWLRGIISNGYLYGIPAWANCILCVDIDAMWGRRKASNENFIQLISLPKQHTNSQWQWHGAALNREETAIYAIPSNAQHVLKLDLQSRTTSLIDIQYSSREYPNLNLSDTNKWYGGILGNDNAVYGMPYRTCAVLRIDTETDTATVVGQCWNSDEFNWHGGQLVDGQIYSFPSNADTVLKIDTTTSSNNQNKVTTLPIHRASYDHDTRKRYKWLGGSVGEDGNIYSMPADASSILKINTKTQKCTTFGFVGTQKNKWQGGVLAPSDGCVYAIPADGKQILRIDTTKKTNDDDDEDEENPIALIGNLPQRGDKWQGAFIGIDGNMYAIPEGSYRILRVKPAPERRKWKNGEIPDDVEIRLL